MPLVAFNFKTYIFFIIFDIFHEILNFCTIFYTYHDFLDIIHKNEYDNQCF